MLNRRRALLTSLGLCLLPLGDMAQPPPLKIVATIALQAALEEIEPLLAARVPVAIEFATTAALVERLENGEAADLAILTSEALQRLAASGRMQAPTDLVRSLIGIAMPEGVPLPSLQTTEDFVAFLRATPSIAYTLRGVSGQHMARLVEDLGLADVVGPKATIVDGFAGVPLREGKVAAAVQQIAELRFTGATNIVPLPATIQVETTFAVAVSHSTAQPEAAAEIVAVLTSPAAASAYERSGTVPTFE